MWPPPDSILVASLEPLWHTGNVQRTQRASQSHSADIDSDSAGVEDAQPGTDNGHADQDLGTGSLYPAWVQIHDEPLNICQGSATKLSSVGATLCAASAAFGALEGESGTNCVATHRSIFLSRESCYIPSMRVQS